MDTRFINFLGVEEMSIQAIQNSIFSLGQGLGIAAATSALIFWLSPRL